MSVAGRRFPATRIKQTGAMRQGERRAAPGKRTGVPVNHVANEEMAVMFGDEWRAAAYITPLPDEEMRALSSRSPNRVCDISDWRAGPLVAMMDALNDVRRIHRKAWEYAACLCGLQRSGVVRGDSRAIAVGAGVERPLFWLANQVKEIVATDIYEDEPGSNWASRFLKDPSSFAPLPYRREALGVRRMPGTALDFPDESFDFAYSLSSIEHFGGHDAAGKAMREMSRVVRPGGMVCIATELILGEKIFPDYFTLEELERHVVSTPGLMMWGEPLDLRISESILRHPINVEREPDLSVSPHIVLTNSSGCVWTSVMLFFQRIKM